MEESHIIVGSVVYPSYSPMKVGVITKIGEPEVWGKIANRSLRGKSKGPEHAPVTVRRANGKEYVMEAYRLKDFNELIQEHKRKAEKFNNMRLALVRAVLKSFEK